MASGSCPHCKVKAGALSVSAIASALLHVWSDNESTEWLKYHESMLQQEVLPVTLPISVHHRHRHHHSVHFLHCHLAHQTNVIIIPVVTSHYEHRIAITNSHSRRYNDATCICIHLFLKLVSQIKKKLDIKKKFS